MTSYRLAARMALLALTVSLVACEAATSTPPPTSTVAPAASQADPASPQASPTGGVATPQPTPAMTPAPTSQPEPTVAPATEVVTTRFRRGSNGAFAVEIKNPNADWGLVRSRFEITFLDKGGAVLGVEGTGGVPGASCCTIYQLAPGQLYSIDGYTTIKLKKVASAEVRIIDEWYPWDEVAEEAATVTLIKPKTRVRTTYGSRTLHVLGRLQVDQEGPFNVQIQALIGGSKPTWVWVSDVVNCVKGGRPYAFDLMHFGKAPVKPKILKINAVVTTVPGYGDTDTAPGCS